MNESNFYGNLFLTLYLTACFKKIGRSIEITSTYFYYEQVQRTEEKNSCNK